MAHPCVSVSGPALTLDALPQEVLSRIFHLVSPEDLARCASVSKSWSEIVLKLKTDGNKEAEAKTAAAGVNETGDTNQEDPAASSSRCLIELAHQQVHHPHEKGESQSANNKAADMAGQSGSGSSAPTPSPSVENSAPSGVPENHTDPFQSGGRFYFRNRFGVQAGTAGVQMSATVNTGFLHPIRVEFGVQTWIEWDKNVSTTGGITMYDQENHERVTEITDPAIAAFREIFEEKFGGGNQMPCSTPAPPAAREPLAPSSFVEGQGGSVADGGAAGEDVDDEEDALDDLASDSDEDEDETDDDDEESEDEE